MNLVLRILWMITVEAASNAVVGIFESYLARRRKRRGRKGAKVDE